MACLYRARFTTKEQDYRSINWPVEHPYWCTGYDSNDRAVILAYCSDAGYIKKNWPEAEDITMDAVEDYVFTSRFPKPDWFNLESNNLALLCSNRTKVN